MEIKQEIKSQLGMFRACVVNLILYLSPWAHLFRVENFGFVSFRDESLGFPALGVKFRFLRFRI